MHDSFFFFFFFFERERYSLHDSLHDSFVALFALLLHSAVVADWMPDKL